MDWAKDLTDENFLAVYDVALDIKADLQLGQQPNIPMVPPVVKFPLLMPADGANMRDRYGNLRWKAMKFLEGKAIIRKINLIDGLHRWETRAELLVNPDLFQEAFNYLEAEFLRRSEPEGLLPEKQSINEFLTISKSASSEFEKVTLLWLVHHVPVKLWLSAIGILFVVVFAGIQIGQISFVREILGRLPASNAFPAEPLVIQERIHRLTEGYNLNKRQIMSQILWHEEYAAKGFSSDERKQHLEAISRLHSLIDEEHIKYLAAINSLRSLQSEK